MKLKKLAAMMTAVVTGSAFLMGCGGGAKTTSAAPAATEAAKEADSSAAAEEKTEAAAAADDVAPMELMAGCTYSTTSTSYQYCLEFADELEKISGGKLTVVWNPASTLGNTTQHYAMMKEGTLDMFSTAFDTASTLQGAQDFNALVVPFIFESMDHYQKFLDSDLLKDMLKPVEEQNNLHYAGAICLNWPRGLSTSNKPVKTPDDIKGLKLRVPEAISSLTVWKAWGANPVSISTSELYASLENGIADGQDNNLISLWNNSYYEVQKYYMELDYIQQANILWLSGNTWEKLNDTQRGWIEEAAKKAYEVNSASVEESYKESKENLINAGIEFVEFDKEAFLKSAEEIGRTFEGDLFREGLYDEIKALNK